MAVARKTRQIVGFHLGDRSRKTAAEFWQTIPKFYQTQGKFYTDLWESYCEVIPSEQHYPSNKKSVVRKGEATSPLWVGRPRAAGQTTRIERLNNTLRHRCSRLVRKRRDPASA